MAQYQDTSWQTNPDQPVSAATLQAVLRGTSYPASKQDLIQTARSNNAPQAILSKIQALPNDDFDSPQEIQQAFRQVK
jgi:hypothetical protein